MPIGYLVQPGSVICAVNEFEVKVIFRYLVWLSRYRTMMLSRYVIFVFDLLTRQNLFFVVCFFKI